MPRIWWPAIRMMPSRARLRALCKISFNKIWPNQTRANPTCRINKIWIDPMTGTMPVLFNRDEVLICLCY